jgi:hypothetical protein
MELLNLEHMDKILQVLKLPYLLLNQIINFLIIKYFQKNVLFQKGSTIYIIFKCLLNQNLQ